MKWAVVVMLALVCSAVGVRAEPGDSAALGVESRVRDLRNRLEALTPARPRAYFELGEEVAAEASNSAGKRLARELFVLAIELDRRGSGPAQSGATETETTIAASACYALASIGETEEQRRWLTAVAATLGNDSAVDAAPLRSTSASRDPAAFELATMLGLLRIGEGRKAVKLLDKPGVSELLDRCDKLLTPGVGGGANRVRTLIDQYPYCSQCRNRRFVKGSDGVSLCPSCRGRPGPILSRHEFVDQLRTESILLSGVQRSWAGQVAADSGAPLRDLDPSEVAAAYRIDPLKPLWRDGIWVADPNAPKPLQQPGNPSADVPGTPVAEAPGAAPATRRVPSGVVPRPK